MLLLNALHDNFYENDQRNLLSIFSAAKENYEKYGNFIVCFNFVFLSFSVISFIMLARLFDSVQEICRAHLITYSLNIFIVLMYITASVLIGIAVKKKSHQYFRKYLVLIIGSFLMKVIQFIVYLTEVKDTFAGNEENCKDVQFIEEKDSTFFMEFLCYGTIIYITFKLKGFLTLMVEINKKLEDMGMERNIQNVYDSFED